MTVRLLARHSLLVGLVASLTSFGGFGCADDKSKSSLDPEGPPRILQVFVADPTTSDDLFGSGYALTYGVHADAWKCGVADNDCGDDPAGDPLTCHDEEHGANKNDALFLHCVDATGATPKSTSAVAVGASIRIISKELLDGTTLEQFACACHATVCPDGAEWSIDPEDCSACGDDEDTPIDESGRCLDVNNDRVPDLSTLQPSVATISCPDAPGFGTNGTYVTAQGDGYYYPSGNQFSPAATGYLGLGPAIVIEPQVALPNGVTCSISVASTVTDKDGLPFDAPNGPMSFRTEDLVVAATDPPAAADDEEVVPVTDTIEIDLSGNVDPETVTATNVGVRVAGTTAFLPLAASTPDMPNPSIDGGAIILTLAADLLPDTTYEIVINDGLENEFGQALGPQEPITFKTEEAM